MTPSDARGREGARSGLGLRVDVDTHEGMRHGVPRLLATFADAGVHATFYLSFGPDRSGLAVLNAFRPGFLRKMRRTGAARVYGLRTILSGTLLPARPTALAFPALARRIREEGHETGVHAWDHRSWQDRLPSWPAERVARELDRGREAYRQVFAADPTTYAAPAWMSNDLSLLHEEGYDLEHASDCRGREPFLPIVAGRALRTPQVPDTFPTLDEALGDTHADADAYFEWILGRVRESTSAWPVLTIHAELEGGPYAAHFARFLRAAGQAGVRCRPLRELLAARLAAGPLPQGRIVLAPVRGRHGLLAQQQTSDGIA